MPIADLGEIFGQIVTRRDVELALVSFLQAWIPTYVAEMERQAQIAPRTVPLPPDQDKSYRGGLDWDSWEQAWSPVFIVNPQAMGSPERQYGPGVYLQPFQVDCCVNFVATNQIRDLVADGKGLLEDNARQYADILGMAACAALLQHGQIGKWPSGAPISTKTYLSRYPVTVYPYPKDRRVARSQFSVVMLVDGVVREAGGPPAPYLDPYQDAPDYPIVNTINVTLASISPSGAISS